MQIDKKYKQLKAIVANYLPEDITIDDVKMNSHFIHELNINSAHLVDIALDVEDEFDILLENEDMEGMKTVEDALKIIDAKLEK